MSITSYVVRYAFPINRDIRFGSTAILIPEGIGIFDIGSWWVGDRAWFGAFCGGISLAFWVFGRVDFRGF